MSASNKISLSALALALSLSIVSTARANTAPKISGTPPSTVQQGGTYSFTATTSDADRNRVRCYISGQPSWLGLDRNTCRASGTVPASVAVGTVYSNITILASDGRATTRLAPFSITVTGNGTMTLSGSPATAVTAGAAYAFTPTLSNTTGKSASYSVANKPSWLTFSTATGSLSGTPTAAQVGPYANITITANNGATQAALAPFTLTVKAGTAANSPPTITGAPVTSVKAGSAYAFRPTATDPNGDALTFTVTGAPAWASFSTSTGQLAGTPGSAQTGSYNNIVISVSDGKGGTASLPGFSILVSSGTTGSASLAWTPPTTTTAGEALTTLAGYRVYYGSSASALTQSVAVANPGLTSYVMTGLTAGVWYFALTAYTSDGQESSQSSVSSKTVN